MKINEKIILVSASPRRKQILLEAGFRFEVISTPVDESFAPDIPAGKVPEILARRKVEAFGNEDPGTIVIGADTVVIVNGTILNKPENRQQAVEMLQGLSHNTHQVVTGVCIQANRGLITFSDTTLVHFKALNDQEIEYYVDHFSPYDKAGGYGVQDFIGMVGIDRIEGSFYTVMGLPVHKVYEHLKPYIRFGE
ncbi:MAG: Maf family protein [Leadbetterella sp.]|nr:Maf family protein [Leadbetterella sp.]